MLRREDKRDRPKPLHIAELRPGPSMGKFYGGGIDLNKHRRDLTSLWLDCLDYFLGRNSKVRLSYCYRH